MIVKKYTAATETDAVLKAREELGSGAVGALRIKTLFSVTPAIELL